VLHFSTALSTPRHPLHFSTALYIKRRFAPGSGVDDSKKSHRSFVGMILPAWLFGGSFQFEQCSKI
jgi:hypothetical protein